MLLSIRVLLGYVIQLWTEGLVYWLSVLCIDKVLLITCWLVWFISWFIDIGMFVYLWNPILCCIGITVLCFVSLQPHAAYLPCDEFNNIILENPFDIMKSKCCKVTNKNKTKQKTQLHLPVHWLRILNTTLHVGDGVVQLIECLTGEGSKDPRFEPRQEHKDNLWALSESNMRWLAVGVPIPRVHTRA